MLLDHWWINKETRDDAAKILSLISLDDRIIDFEKEEIVPIDITDIAHSSVAHMEEIGASRKNRMVTLGEMFPVVTPPWKLAWYEWLDPNYPGNRFGVLLSSFLTEDYVYNTMASMREAVIRAEKVIYPSSDFKQTLFVDRSQTSDADIEERIRGLRKYSPNAFSHHGGAGICYYRNKHDKADEVTVIQMFHFLCDDKGAIGENWWGQSCCENDLLDTAKTAYYFIVPIMYANCVANCKNVTLVDSDAETPAKVIKKRQKKFGQYPLITFKRLVITPSAKSQGTARSSVQITGNVRHHLARGHFKDYRDSGGLFGKHKGIYWWGMHMRGNENIGAVKKEYDIKSS